MDLTDIKQEAFALRNSGESYSSIHQLTGIPKSTLSYWFSKSDFSNDVTKTLNDKWKVDSRQRILMMNTARKEIHADHIESIKKEAAREYNYLKNDPLFKVGLALYWGEGSKTDNGRVSVVNSDPALLKVVLAFYRHSLRIPNEKIRAEMFIYKDHDEAISKLFWSTQLQLDPKQFIKTQVLPSRSTHTKRKLSHGLCTLYCSNTDLSIKIREWIIHLALDCENSSVG
jgi:hypothetical protein